MQMRKRSCHRSCFGLVLGLCALYASSGSAQHQTLFSFKANEGAQPSGLVRASDGRLYGTSHEGGAYGKGTVFSLAPDATTPEVLHAFTGQGDGAGPSTLVDGGDYLYGLSALPAAVDVPERVGLFRLDRAGAFQVLESVPGTADSVRLTRGADGRVYGATASSTKASVFCVDADGSISTIYAFSDGTRVSTLAAGADGRLYGTTQSESGDASKLFSVTHGGEYKALASIPGATESSSAQVPTALALDAVGTLYVGVRTEQGGLVYRYKDDGPLTQLSELDAAPTVFASGMTNGVSGATVYGGAAKKGSVFHLAANGTLSTLHSFAGDGDGAAPAALALDGDTVYGVAADGGAGNGSIFRVTAAQEFSSLYVFTYRDGVGPSSLVRADDGNFYGVTQAGGANSSGTVFKVNAAGEVTTLHAFTEAESAAPVALSAGVDGLLYGRTTSGGASGNGTVFSLATTGELTTLVDFSEPDQGNGPGLVQTADGTLYGVDQVGSGHIFRITASGQVENVYSFPGLETHDGASPNNLIVGPDGALYGTTLGAYGPLIPPNYSSGTVFRLATDGTFSTLYAFGDDDNALGAAPRSLLFGQDGKLYGTSTNLTFVCGTFGGIWTLDPSSKVTEQVYAFEGLEDGTGPTSLIETTANVFYGLTFGGVGPRSGDDSSCGVRNSTLFKYDTALTTLESLPYVIAASLNSNDLGRAANVIDGKDGRLYGVIANGGAAGAGEIFAFDLTAQTPPD